MKVAIDKNKNDVVSISTVKRRVTDINGRLIRVDHNNPLLDSQEY